MRVGLVVDSACDLPQSYYRKNNIVVLPITVRQEGRTFVDVRDPDQTQMFYRQHLANASGGETSALGVDDIKRLFLDRLVIDYDFVFCLTIASARSPIYDNATKASFSILSDYKPIRAAAGHTTPFALRVVDTQNLFAAQGVLAVEVAKMIGNGDTPLRIRERIDALLPHLYGYMLPDNLFHLRARAAKKGDKSVGWLQYALGTALDIKALIRGYRNDTQPVAKLRHFQDGVKRCFQFLTERIRDGLLAPTICLSYAGDLEDLFKMPGYTQFAEYAAERGVAVHASMMSITGVVNVGEGALAFGFCAPEHEFT